MPVTLLEFTIKLNDISLNNHKNSLSYELNNFMGKKKGINIPFLLSLSVKIDYILEKVSVRYPPIRLRALYPRCTN